MQEPQAETLAAQAPAVDDQAAAELAAPVNNLPHCLRALGVPVYSALQQMAAFSGTVLSNFEQEPDGGTPIGLGMVKSTTGEEITALLSRDRMLSVLGPSQDPLAAAMGSLLLVSLANAQEIALAFDCLMNAITQMRSVVTRAHLLGIQDAAKVGADVDAIIAIVKPEPAEPAASA